MHCSLSPKFLHFICGRLILNFSLCISSQLQRISLKSLKVFTNDDFILKLLNTLLLLWMFAIGHNWATCKLITSITITDDVIMTHSSSGLVIVISLVSCRNEACGKFFPYFEDAFLPLSTRIINSQMAQILILSRPRKQMKSLHNER